ncbi:21422_t:CDS:2 [Entrophospora sp. SA101]|nr:21422_t:CDS:2 [Entrophospora sp. SA101]
MVLHDCIDFELAKEEKILIVVGVEFGTKFSTFSYAYIKPEKEKIEIVVNQEWGHFKSPYKPNTVLQYDEDYKEVVSWGADALRSEPRRRKRHTYKLLPRLVEDFKLHLENIPESQKPKLPPGITFDKAITDYLREMALGDATSFQLGSQDSNSAGQLSKDIGNLHKNLDKFCGLKKGIKINESEVKKLLRKFGCSIAGSKIHNSKNLISGVLERHVIETIIEKTQNYFNNDKGNKQDDEQDDEKQQSLEVKMVKTTEQLSKLTDSISKYRTGDEEVSKATSTKLRQQIYGVLGNRGFSNIAVGKEDKKHPLIATLQKDILDLMNCYRTITNPEKLSENEEMIDKIVRQVVNIFFFRLKVQEPVAKVASNVKFTFLLNIKYISILTSWVQQAEKDHWQKSNLEKLSKIKISNI